MKKKAQCACMVHLLNADCKDPAGASHCNLAGVRQCSHRAATLGIPPIHMGIPPCKTEQPRQSTSHSLGQCQNLQCTYHCPPVLLALPQKRSPGPHGIFFCHFFFFSPINWSCLSRSGRAFFAYAWDPICTDKEQARKSMLSSPCMFEAPCDFIRIPAKLYVYKAHTVELCEDDKLSFLYL